MLKNSARIPVLERQDQNFNVCRDRARIRICMSKDEVKIPVYQNRVRIPIFGRIR